MFGIFYGEDDKKEIRGWDTVLRKELLQKLSKYLTQEQFQEYDKGYSAQFEALNSEITSTKKQVDDLKNKIAPPIDIEPFRKELDALNQRVDDLKNKIAPPIDIEPFKKELDTLRLDVDDLKNKISQPSPELEAVKRELLYQRQVNAQLSQSIGALQAQLSAAIAAAIEPLKQEIAAQNSTIESLKKEIEDLKNKPKTETESETEPETESETESESESETDTTGDERYFYLPEQTAAFFPNDRKQIPEKIKAALSVGDIQRYLIANPSATSNKFQKLLTNHLRDAKKFIDKLKLSDAEDDELSEVVTIKYFKLFHRIIFDNFIVSIKRGLGNSTEYYSGLLAAVNEYLSRCGIYTVNATANRKAESDDYENMSPQTLKTNDATLNGTISEIERLPYRINYLDEFGEQKYFQYPGVMNVYKAV